MDEFGYEEKKQLPLPLKATLKIANNEVPEINTNKQKSVNGEESTMLKHKRSFGHALIKRWSSTPATDGQTHLPQSFVVKYLGFRETKNIWGIKHTRKSVEEMVENAKSNLTAGKISLPLLCLEVLEDGIQVGPMPQNANPNALSEKFKISSISYGVQDLIYSRVFAMIVVNTSDSPGSQNAATSIPPFRCHAFVTDTRETAKNLTYALAAAFHCFSRRVSIAKVENENVNAQFTIDLRSKEALEADLADSEV